MSAAERTSGRPVSDTRLFLLSLRAFAGGFVLLGAITLITAAALAGWPRVTSGVLTAELRHELDQAGAGGRDLATTIRTGTLSRGPEVDPARLWDELPAIASSVHAKMPAALRTVAAEGDGSARSEDLPSSGPKGAASNSRYSIAVEAYRGLRTEARLVEGRWPEAVTVGGRSKAADIPIVVSETTAKLLGWKVGEVRQAGGSPETHLALRLVGTVQPRDPAADFWDVDPTRDRGHYVDGGDAGKDFGGVSWVAPETWQTLAPQLDATTATIWFPLDPRRFTAEDLSATRSAIGGFLASPPVVAVGGTPVPVTFATAVQQPIDDFLAQAQPAQTLFAILLSGPLVVALAVLAQGARLVAGRRRPAAALMAARGASPARLSVDLAAQSALVSVPGAALGLIVALVLTPGAQPLALPIALAAVCAMLAPLALVLTNGGPGPSPAERASSRPLRPRWAWVAEVVVLGLAIASVATVVRRGLASTGASAGVDPLTALTPVLVALAACVVVVRVTGIPLGWLASALRRARGPVAFLGASGARSARSGVLWPVFTLVAGVSIALFSVSMLSTTTAGLAEGARARVGADLSLTAAGTLTQKQVDAVRRIPGVARTATVEWAGGLRLTAGGASSDVSGYLVDPRELDAVQHDLPADARLSSSLSAGIAGRTGAALGGWAGQIPITSALIVTGGTNVHLGVTELDYTPGVYVRDGEWVFIDRTALPSSAGITGRPQTVLVALAPGADAAGVHQQLARIGGAGALVGDAIAERDRLRSSPLVAGTEQVAVLSILLTVLLSVAALLLTLVINTAARIRLVATLRTIGYSSRQTAGVLAWELGPVLVVGLAAGAVVGLVLPTVVLDPLDLRGFTGSPVQPPVVQDPALAGSALAGFVVVGVVATAIALVGARRRAPATVLRNAGGE